MTTSIFVDGGFFLKRYRYFHGNQSPEQAARDMHKTCILHLQQNKERRELYRIFFYDCPPLQKKVHNPLSKKAIDLSKSTSAVWRDAFHNEIRKLRKVALRLGYLNERTSGWVITPEKQKALLNGTLSLSDLTEKDVQYEARQKGVDMKLGLDVASIAYKRLCDQIILIAGDSDFVPAAKLARREGIDFILDPLWSNIREDLHEHVDGLRSIWHKHNGLVRRETSLTDDDLSTD